MNKFKLPTKKYRAVVIALLTVIAMTFPTAASAVTIPFLEGPAVSAGTSGGKGEVGPRGFAIDINGEEEGGLYWLESEYDNTYFFPTWTGEVNGYSEEIPTVDENGEKIVYHFNAYVDKNPGGNIHNQNEGPFVVLYKNGEKVDLKGNITVGGTEMPKVGTPIRGKADRNGNMADPSGQTGRWTVPITLTLEPNCNYEFAFLQGLTANNKVTCVVSEIKGDNAGYLQYPTATEPTEEQKAEGMTMSELDWYNAHKYDEYQYREYKYQTYKEDGSLDKNNVNPNVGRNHRMVFSFKTAAIPVIAATKVAVSPTSATLTVGSSKTLKATVYPSNATNKDVAWKTSNIKVAKVSSKGVVTAVAPGKVVVTATTKDGGFKATTIINVIPKSPSFNLYAKKGAVTIKYRKVDGVSGYVIYRATSKTGNYKAVKVITQKSTTSYTNTKLSKSKTYYYKMRTYKTVDGKKIYSKYTEAKKIRTK